MPPKTHSRKTILSEESVSHQGERILEIHGGKIFQEHAQRYSFALRYIRPGDLVLDCACGTGYGTKMLSAGEVKVIGMDISPTAIAYCRENYSAPNIDFKKGSAEALKIKPSSINHFISFETIEHIPHPRKLVQEAKRVLKPGGRFIVSTPNRIVSGLKSGEKPSNPFHLMEWSLLEFDRILRPIFPKITYFAQRIKSKNIFHPMYCLSKMRKFAGMAEILPLNADEDLFQRLESEKSWQPSIFIAVCEK